MTARLQYAERNPSTLKPWPGNPRKISAKARAKLKRGLQAFGLVDPIIVRRRDQRVLGGHQRLDVALELKLKRVPTIQVDGLSDAQADALTALLNNPEAQGTWDMSKLSALVSGLGPDLGPLTGFDAAMLERLAHWSPDGRRKDPEVATPATTSTKRGEIWQLGPHRLMCGDATNMDDVARLMFGDDGGDQEHARVVITDPPYGVSYRGGLTDGRAPMPIAGDDLRGDALIGLLKPAFLNAVAVSSDDAAFYIWHATATRQEFEYAMKAAGLEERQYLVWVKDSFSLGMSDYQWQTEPCFYAQAGQRARYLGDRTQSTVWRLDRPELAPGPKAVSIDPALEISNGAGSRIWVGTKAPKAKRIRAFRLEAGQVLELLAGEAPTDAWQVSSDPQPYQHPTQKPAELAARALRNSSEPGDVVLDLFGGGGFTLLGAELTGRRARVMELDPKYCDVIRARWAAMTGAAADHDSHARPATGGYFGPGVADLKAALDRKVAKMRGTAKR